MSLAAHTGCQTFCEGAGRKPWRAAAFCFFFFILRMAGADTELSETNLIPQNAKLWTESMLWGEQIGVYSGIGYNNNVFLSAFNPRGSGFFVNGLDAAITRVPLDGWQVVAGVAGDDIRYWHTVAGPGNVNTSREDSFLATVTGERELPYDWQAGLEARGLYEHQVLDVSLSTALPATALVEGYGITGQPYVRKNLPAGFWLKLEFPVTRWLLAEPLDDYWEFGPIVTAGHDFGTRGDVTLSYGFSYERHDQWVALDAVGEPLPQRLEIAQHRAELAWHQYWDTHRYLRSSTRLVFAYNVDNGGGIFNYYQYQAIEDLRWGPEGWQFIGSAQVAYESYPVQGVGILNGQKLYRDLLSLSLEVQRRLVKDWKCFGKVEYQWANSNEALNADDYQGTTISGGLRFEF